jgi:hypothetical protein
MNTETTNEPGSALQEGERMFALVEWAAYTEQVVAKAAARVGAARAAAAQLLPEFPASAGEAWQEQKERVTTALDDLDKSND